MINILKRTSVLFLVGALTFQGCKEQDIIELQPEFSLDAANNPSTIAQVEQVLDGAYSNFRANDYYGSGSGTGGGAALMPDVMSDNLYETLQTLANSRAMADWVYQQNTAQINNTYNAMYKVISVANIVLRDVDKFATPANQKRINRIKGQALTIRALAHFDLFRYFTTNYDRNSTTTLALYYSKSFKVAADEKPARVSNKVYYDDLFADLTAAEPLLSDVDVAVNPVNLVTRPRLSLAALHVLRARISLYAGLWADAIAAANKGIAVAPALVSNQTTFSGMYNGAAAGESIWNVQFDAGQNGPTFLVFFATNNRSYFRPALEIATVAGTTGLIRSNDIRYSAYFTTIGGGVALTKYKGKGTVSDGNANFLAMKTAELYLIRAEAYARNNQDALGMADLNTLRTARIANYVPEVLTGASLQTAIADERRRELIGEGHRFFDLKRTTRTITRGSTCGVISISPSGKCSLAPTAREWSLPIPEAVTNANANMVQNPEWK
jgi:starch-binding outer membrane protein, SusD/RagB family